jgi:Arc/MetJ-type ribon-helix-helix transcriptional regulator
LFDVARISLRLTREQYRALKLLVEEGVFPSISDALREAIVKLLKEQSARITRAQT